MGGIKTARLLDNETETKNLKCKTNPKNIDSQNISKKCSMKKEISQVKRLRERLFSETLSAFHFSLRNVIQDVSFVVQDNGMFKMGRTNG